MISFSAYLDQQIAPHGLATEDVLAACLPLMEQVADAHRDGFVAPLEGVESLSVEGRRLQFFADARRPPRENLSAVRKLQAESSSGVAVVRSFDQHIDLTDCDVQQADHAILDPNQPVESFGWLPDYRCWEHHIQHHDPLTDVFSLGMILASVACGLNFARPADLQRFVQHRGNLFRLKADLHPVLARVIVLMTELNRHQRPADLRALRSTLENYRDHEVDFETDLARETADRSATQASSTQLILGKLQERLFEINRRNRLLQFRATAQSVNLTESSIPLSFDPESIRPRQVLTWTGMFQKKLAAGKPVVLNRYLNFREAVYLPGSLDRIRAEARRDENDYGFAQLRLIIAFLRWSDLKVEPAERFESPLLLVPVRLSVRRGIHDRYVLDAVDCVAEVNPVVRHQFLQLYGLTLPESVELTDDAIHQFTADLRDQIVDSDQSVELHTVDRPRVEIIHAKAKRRLNQHTRRTRMSPETLSEIGSLPYSYDVVGYQPLGVQLFEQYVQAPRGLLARMLPLAAAAGHSDTPKRPPARRTVQPADEPQSREAEGRFYRLLDQTDDNPRRWEVDFCAVTLANLKYRRMSLARDYAELITRDRRNAAFAAAFALTDRAPLEATGPVDVADRFNVLPADPTQMSAVVRSGTGHSYIIQGPPGTGKSQTIANLIAELVQRGRRILFVCEKRAAVDVVHHRLKQLGLEDLCCLIHDSQADKKQFVLDLKKSFQDSLNDASKERGRHRHRRDQVADQLQQHLAELQQMNDQMTQSLPGSDVTVRQLYDRLIEDSEAEVVLPPALRDRVPAFDVWGHAEEQLAELQRSCQHLVPDDVLANHPLSLLSDRLIEADHPVERVQQLLQQIQPLLNELQQSIPADWPAAVTDSFQSLAAAVEFARELDFLTDRSLLDLLNSESELAKRFTKSLEQLHDAERRQQQATQNNQHWKTRLSLQDTQTALQIAEDLEQSWRRWFSPRWWNLRKQMRQAYDFDQHMIRPTTRATLQKLHHEYECAAACDTMTQQISREFNLPQALPDFLTRLDQTHDHIQQATGSAAAVIQHGHFDARASRLLQSLLSVDAVLNRTGELLDQLMQDYEQATMAELIAACDQLSADLGRMPKYLHCVKLLDQLDDRVERAVRTVPATVAQLTQVAIRRSLQQLEIRDPRWAMFRHSVRLEQLDQLKLAYQQLQTANAEAVREQVCQRFCDRMAMTERPAAQLSTDEKEFKKVYKRGRRVLEHEFGKSMRFKSIRELTSGDSGQVVRDLKPVWLMSPLSVSDTLPLDEQEFDTVVFDEASQITLEDAVPALFRAAQTIVVGDEMQLPPTSFFNSRGDDEDEFFLEDEGEPVQYDLNSSSLLNHAAGNLPSTLLGWHYRSQSESLISFSNHAFYDGRLLTVPEERLAGEEASELHAERAEDARPAAAQLMDRAVSFHLMQHGVYEKRRNRPEADYIAELVRTLLMDSSVSHSIGIVAFSEAQQSEIERSIHQLAAGDADFAERLEAELERDDDGQFAGLLIRNLENIQGDERDIIILSVCYGPDPEGRVRMNFGPINMAGGEKRLNVAFSRARKHMALVTSMRYAAVTNDYNDGANCLKRYLRYAEACSVGRTPVVQEILRSLSSAGDRSQQATSEEPLRKAIADDLREQGCIVDTEIGQSAFRVDLAVRLPKDRQYRLGILIDSGEWYAQPDLLERELLKPELLRHFGWTIEVVHARDWYEQPDECRQRFQRVLQPDSDFETDA